MKTADLILQFLRSAAWRTHIIRTAEEAYIDLLACPEDERPKSVVTLAERWHLSRPTTSKLIAEMQTKNFIDSQNHVITDVKTFDTDVKTFDTDVKTFDTPPSRDNEDNNINALSDDKANKKIKRVRENFVRPSPEEVNAYLRQIGETDIDGQAFCDYYECCGWVVGRDRKPMKSWQAAVRYWQRNRKKQPSFQSSNPPHHYANSPTPHRYPSDRAAERAERQQQFARHIQRLLDDPGAEQQPTLDF